MHKGSGTFKSFFMSVGIVKIKHMQNQKYQMTSWFIEKKMFLRFQHYNNSNTSVDFLGAHFLYYAN